MNKLKSSQQQILDEENNTNGFGVSEVTLYAIRSVLEEQDLCLRSRPDDTKIHRSSYTLIPSHPQGVKDQ